MICIFEWRTHALQLGSQEAEWNYGISMLNLQEVLFTSNVFEQEYILVVLANSQSVS